MWYDRLYIAIVLLCSPILPLAQEQGGNQLSLNSEETANLIRISGLQEAIRFSGGQPLLLFAAQQGVDKEKPPIINITPPLVSEPESFDKLLLDVCAISPCLSACPAGFKDKCDLPEQGE